jgi:hypothetical protein
MTYSRNNALYLPAVQPNYAGFDANTGRLGWYDDTIHNFLKDNGGLYYPQALYSAGHAEWDLSRSREKEPMIHDRSDESILVADSGGFQIAEGNWQVDWGNWLDAENLRHSILNWQESGFDYAMTLDLPPWAIEKGQVPFTTMRECLDVTKENLDFIRDNRKGNAKFLNVLQGETEQDADIWFNEVWQYPFEGWAVAGKSARDLELLLRRLIKLRDGHLLTDRDWLHVLGVGSLTVACVLTECQNQLRELVNRNLTISFDTSSPSTLTIQKKRMMYGHRDFFSPPTKKGFNPDYYEAPTMRRHANDNRTLFDFMAREGERTPTHVSSQIHLSDLCREKGSVWDGLSYFLITNHNYEVFFNMLDHAYTAYHRGNHQYLPRELFYFKEEIAPEIFKSETPMTTIKRHATTLKRLRLCNTTYKPEPNHAFTGWPVSDYTPVWK